MGPPVHRGRQSTVPDEHACWGDATLSEAEQRLLRGRPGRLREAGRTLRIALELIRGFRALRGIEPAVTVFGSARLEAAHAHYWMAREMGARLATAGFAVVTGGGPGAMEAANRGAREAGGLSIGCNIDLPVEQRPNAYLDRCVTFRHFYVRKVMLLRHSCAFVALPGGLGTLDEVFETATLIQTGKIVDFPLVLMGIAYWQRLLDFLGEDMVHARTVDAGDVSRILATDSPTEALACIVHCTTRRFGFELDRPRRG